MFAGSMHQPPYSPNASYAMNTPHPYANYPATSCNYPRQLQMGADSRYPQMGRSLSPGRRGYADAMPMHLNYHGMHPKMQAGPNYAQYRGPEYAQHYQHRRGPPQECYPPSCRPAQYLQNPHQTAGQDLQDMAGNTASPSDSLKKFIESWIVEEEPAGEASQLDANMNIREKLRDDAPAGTVYMINANDVHYFENNGIPIVTSDSGGFQLPAFFEKSQCSAGPQKCSPTICTLNTIFDKLGAEPNDVGRTSVAHNCG
ncbi:hypothetical protein HUJ05_005977 [Dendroctonus ponderosae]|nr:hypothetical protein HUJ05_005977 [Dendroctonus ponderosae]